MLVHLMQTLKNNTECTQKQNALAGEKIQNNGKLTEKKKK